MVRLKEVSSEKESNDKRRNKTSSVDATPSNRPVEDIYETGIGHEEQEALKRSPEKDMTLFHKTCEELKTIFEEVAALKKDNSEKAKSDIHEKRIQGSLIFPILKKLNRLDKVRVRRGREALHKEKLRVDSNRLQLQNLLYESNHLKREVQRCYQFKSQDEEIDLVSEEEFYKNAPETISRPDKTKNDEHARRLARLEWELEQRKLLSSLCKELTIAKQSAFKDITSKTERLESLTPRLEALLKATKPLQSALDMNIEEEWEVQKSARLLPRPLYLVYANLSAYAEACMPQLSVIIEGDEEEARQLEIDESKEKQEEDENQESDLEDGELETRKKHHKRLFKSDEPPDNKYKYLLKPHPLSVTFKISEPKGAATSIAVTLRYLPVLDFITATPYIQMENTGVISGDVISPESILNCLYPGDLGNESPNPKTKYQLKVYGIDNDKLVQLLLEHKIGKPFKWAQRLCGFQFIDDQQSFPSPSRCSINRSTLTNISSDLAQNSVITIIKLIKSRWQSRLGLFKQIHALENKNIDSLPSTVDTIPTRISSSLVQWTSIPWEDYSSNIITQRFIEENLVNSNDMFYRAIITRGSAKLECFICISSNFPTESPVWALILSWNGRHDALNNTAIRDMEFFINSSNIPKMKLTILSMQLRRAMSSLDIFLETEGPLYSPAEFTQDKTFLKAFRGRIRSRPYKIVQNGGTVFYKQL